MCNRRTKLSIHKQIMAWSWCVTILLAASCTSGSSQSGSLGPVPSVSSTVPVTSPDDSTERAEQAPSAVQPGVPPPEVEANMGDPVEDEFGNLLTVHGVHQVPIQFVDLSSDEVDAVPDYEAFLHGSGSPTAFLEVGQRQDPDFNDGSEQSVQAVSSLRMDDLIAIDFAVCAGPGDSSTSEPILAIFQVINDETDPLAPSASVVLAQPDRTRHDRAGSTDPAELVWPAFTWPTSAACTRGWIVATWANSRATKPIAVRYWLGSGSGSGDSQPYYEWTRRGPSSDSPLFSHGLSASDNVALAAGEDEILVRVQGWAEVPSLPGPGPKVRWVGVLLEVCAEELTAELDLALGFEAWKLLEATDAPPALEDPLFEPERHSCRQGWSMFRVPFGAIPDWVSASYGSEARSPLMVWSLDAAALKAPQ